MGTVAEGLAPHISAGSTGKRAALLLDSSYHGELPGELDREA